ncbi:MAG: PEP/pyruvate-binding domain-containing protein, partial [Planctomycetota bacterium]|nr:PEP/pyruvate-binding domain-containing protein [Planctomycetota bacterium]
MPRAKARTRGTKRTSRSKDRFIWHFGPKGSDGDASMKDLLGGKGANLAEMCHIGLPVPPGFTIATNVCQGYYDAGRKLPAEIVAQVRTAVKRLEKETGKGFGDPARPLLVSVRSGAAISMPGMMDTV